VVEQPPPATEEAAKTEEKPAVKEKKPRTPREKKPKQPKTATHPPYFQMVKDALLALNEKSGSSPYAIAKYMEEKHKAVLPANFKKILGLQLKNSAARGKLIKIKASYKLAEAKAKEKEKMVPSMIMTRSSTTKKPRTPKKTRSVNKVEATAPPKKPAGGGGGGAKKVGAKRSKKSITPAAAAKPKQPKSIKSPAAKRAKRATAS